jgi:hypothetical protein
MISSPLMTGAYERTVPDYTAHNDRELPMTEGVEGVEGVEGDQADSPESLDPAGRSGGDTEGAG